MDFLSQEILALVIRHIYEVPAVPNPRPWHPKPVGKVASYATILRQWQYAVERFTFASLHVYSNGLPFLQDFFSKKAARRQRLLRRLHYEIDLPIYDERRACCLERP